MGLLPSDLIVHGYRGGIFNWPVVSCFIMQGYYFFCGFVGRCSAGRGCGKLFFHENMGVISFFEEIY